MLTFINLMVMAVLTVLEYSHKISVPTYMYFVWTTAIMLSAALDYIIGRKLLEFTKHVKKIAEKEEYVRDFYEKEPNSVIGFANEGNGDKNE